MRHIVILLFYMWFLRDLWLVMGNPNQDNNLGLHATNQVVEDEAIWLHMADEAPIQTNQAILGATDVQQAGPVPKEHVVPHMVPALVVNFDEELIDQPSNFTANKGMMTLHAHQGII